MGLNFALYETFKSNLEILDNSLHKLKFLPEKNSENTSSGLKILGSGFCGALSGGISKFLVFPLDTIKKRMQAQGLTNTLFKEGGMSVPRYSSMSQCLVHTLRDEGVKGLYKVRI